MASRDEEDGKLIILPELNWKRNEGGSGMCSQMNLSAVGILQQLRGPCPDKGYLVTASRMWFPPITYIYIVCQEWTLIRWCCQNPSPQCPCAWYNGYIGKICFDFPLQFTGLFSNLDHTQWPEARLLLQHGRQLPLSRSGTFLGVLLSWLGEGQVVSHWGWVLRARMYAVCLLSPIYNCLSSLEQPC